MSSVVANARRIGFVCALLGALGFSFKAVLIKAAYRYGVDAETLLALRMGYSLPWFAIMAVVVAWREPLALDRRDWWMLLLLGVTGYYAASYLDFLGLKYITASLERLILFLYPTMVVLLSALFLHQPLSRKLLVPMTLCYLGIALAVSHDLSVGGRDVLLGGVLVFASALSYAVYMMLSGQVVRRLGSMRVTAWATGIACILSLAQFLLLRPVSNLVQPWQVHALGLAMALFSTVLPVWLVAEAMRRIGAGTTSLIGTLGPVLTIALAAVFLGEPLTLMQVMGAGLVIWGVLRLR